MDDLINLPQNMLFLLLSRLKLFDLSNICTASRELDAICRSRDFWAFKYNQDFSEPFPKFYPLKVLRHWYGFYSVLMNNNRFQFLQPAY